MGLGKIRPDSSGSCYPSKEVCWDLKKRGGVGETILHVCFLVGGADYMLLAQRLITVFPKLINDIYVSDEYFGKYHMYWGEYPLSFAACLSQEECFRLLIANGADPNAQDSNGNTVLHIMTIRDDENMFDLALLLRAKLHLKNRQGLIPLTLAAKLAKHKMLDHILQKEREVYWTYGGVTCAAYPLTFTDSIQPETGQINRNSTLALVVYGRSIDHLKCFHDLLQELLRKKWDTFAKRRLFRQFGIFVLYFLVLRILLELLAVSGACGYLVQVAMEIRNVGRKLYLESLSGFPAKAIFLVSCVLMVLMVPLRLICLSDMENILSVIVVLLTGMKFLFFCRGIKMVGPFVLMIYKIVVGDLLRFFIIYGIFAAGFSQAFYIIFLGYRSEHDMELSENETQAVGVAKETGQNTIMTPIFESFMRMFIMSLNEFGVFYSELGHCKLSGLGKVMFVLYVCLVSILLMNLLIAMMTNTYTLISQSQNEWLRQESEKQEIKEELEKDRNTFASEKFEEQKSKKRNSCQSGVVSFSARHHP